MPDEKKHGNIRYYTVIYKESKEGEEEKEQVISPKRKIELTRLEMYTDYTIQVLAATVKGDGPRSDPIFVKTDQDSK